MHTYSRHLMIRSFIDKGLKKFYVISVIDPILLGGFRVTRTSAQLENRISDMKQASGHRKYVNFNTKYN